ncbi:MAG: ABC-type multidrug transport system ATPase component [Bacteroidetes bacterium]|nr:ABC-type multidrug transport system ATPase component [Bacteroidota bacterium]
MAVNAIEVENLTKFFGEFCAVDHINFGVRQGEIFGFLGANGAGKSTTIRMLCGLLQSTQGTARVGGFDINSQPEKVKETIGYMSQKFSLYEDLTVDENINFYGKVYGLSNGELAERKRWVLEMANLKGRQKSITGTLSGGWKQRLALGCAVLHRPRIVFLDEPTSGVDPLMRRRFWELINDLSADGITVLVTTHYLEEAEYCNDIILINAGKIIAGGSPKQLKEEHIKTPILEVQCSNVIDALALLEEQAWVIETSVFGTYMHVSVSDEKKARRDIRRILNQRDIQVDNIERITPSLEDVFIFLLDQEAKRAA